jgi:hypothetical protein
MSCTLGWLIEAYRDRRDVEQSMTIGSQISGADEFVSSSPCVPRYILRSYPTIQYAPIRGVSGPLKHK